MPYIIVHSGDGYCIHKQDEAGQPMGDPMGCHPSEQEAQDQVAAIYANESKPPAPPKDGDTSKAVVAQHGEEWCVFESGPDEMPMGDPMECFATEEEANASLESAPSADKPDNPFPPKAAKWMTLEQVRTVCVPCAQKMSEVGIDRVNVVELSAETQVLLSRAAVLERMPEEKAPVKSEKAGYADIRVAEWVAVGKDAEKGKARVLGVPFGSPEDKDADGQWFTDKTDLMLQPGDTRPVIYYHGMGPSGSPVNRPEVIGKATVAERDADGQWFEVEIDEAKTLGRRVWDGIKRGIARASSGAIAHLARISKSGEILTWPVGELSLIDVGMGREPANFNAVALPIKSMYKDAELELPEAFRQVLTDSAEAVE